MLDNDDIPLAMMAAQALYKIGTPEALAAIQHLKRGDEYDFSVPPTAPQPEADEEPHESFRGISPDLLESLREADDEEAQPARAREMHPAPRRRTCRSAAVHSTADRADAPHPPTRQPKHQPTAPPAADPVQFSAYYPPEAVSDVWYPLRAYVFRASAADAISADAARELGGLLSAFRKVVRTALGNVTTGALITATPELPGFQFNPPSAQIGFYEDWHRFDFKLRATAAAADQASNGRITFTVEGVIVADVPISIFVGANVDSSAAAARPQP